MNKPLSAPPPPRVSFSYYDLIEAFASPGCAICHVLTCSTDRFLDSLLYEYANDPDSHRAFRKGRGLCNLHSWQLQTYHAGVLGVAILYAATLDEVLNVLAQAPPETDRRFSLKHVFGSQGHEGALLADRLEPAGPCIVCEQLELAEARYTWILSHHIFDERLQHAYRQSHGLCLPHFRMALRQAPDPASVRRLVEIQREHWSKLADEVREFIRKSDYQHVNERMEAERDSWLRAIARMAGEKGVFGLRRRSE